MYDAIIIGAGPAGLSLASELSKKHKILIIEKNKKIGTTKDWATEKKIVIKAGLESCIGTTFRNPIVKTFTDNSFKLKSEIVGINELKLFKKFTSMIKQNDSKILLDCEYKGILRHKNENQIAVKTSKGNFKSNLLIDCLGVHSKLAKKYKIFDNIFYCPVYGEVYDLKQGTYEVRLSDIFEKKRPITWFELTPLSTKQCVTYSFQFLSRFKDPLTLKGLHKSNIKKCHIGSKLKNKKCKKELYGVIPLGIPNKHCVDNIFFFGDSSLIAGPTLTAGFTTIIQHYKKFAKHLSTKIKSKKFSEVDLEYSFSEIEKINRTIQEIAASIITHATCEDIDSFFTAVSKLPPRIVVDILMLRINLKQLKVFLGVMSRELGIKKFLSIIKKEKFNFIAKGTFELIEEIIVEEIEEIKGKHHKSI